MSDFPKPVFPNETKETEVTTSKRKSRKRLLVAALVAVVALIAVSMLMHLGPFADDAKDSGSAQQDTTPVDTWSYCPEGQIAVSDYANTPPGGPMAIKCLTQDEYDRQQDEEWATNRQSTIDNNVRLQAGIDELQAQFDAAPTLSGKLGRVLTIFCHSDLRGKRFQEVPAEKRSEGSVVTTTPPSSPSTYGTTNPIGSHYDPPGYYDPFTLSGAFDERAEQLWNINWDAQAVNFALPASFELAVAQMGCDNR